MHPSFNVRGEHSDRSTRIIIIRHAQSTYNAQGLYQGCCDESVLTEKGWRSADQTGLALRGMTVNAVYTSPLRRTQETTRAILSAMSTLTDTLPQPQTHPQLKEVDLPTWQGLAFQSVREQFAEDYRCWRERPHEFQMTIQSEGLSASGTVATLVQSGFPVRDLYAQARQFWQEILPRHVGQTVLIISHGGTIRALINTAIAPTSTSDTLPLEARYHTLQQSNCGITILNFPNPNQAAQLEAMNLTTHLGEVLPKLKEGKQGVRLLLLRSDAIKSQQAQRLATFFQSIPLDFCIRDDLSSSRAIAELILASKVGVQLQIARQDFSQALQHILSPDVFAEATLSTGLVVATELVIKAMLESVLDLLPHESTLHVHPGAISVIHYPSAVSLPVLQVMNLSIDQSFETVPGGK